MSNMYSWKLLFENEDALRFVRKDIKGEVERFVTIIGEVKISKSALIRSGSYIIGPVVIGRNCEIGPNCYIRPKTKIGDNCKIGHNVEIKNSLIMDNTKIAHLSYIGDSIIGKNVNIGGGTIIANLRHDNANIKTEVNGKLVDSGRRKLGVIIGDGASIGINTCFYPGRKMWPNTTTKPGEIVIKNIM